MGWKLRNKKTGFEIPLAAKPMAYPLDGLTYSAWIPSDRQSHQFQMADYDLVEDFEFPTKLFAIIQCESVRPGGKPGLFHWDANGYWTTPHGEGFNPGYLREKFRNFKVLFEGVDES